MAPLAVWGGLFLLRSRAAAVTTTSVGVLWSCGILWEVQRILCARLYAVL